MSLKIDSPRPPQIKIAEPRVEKPKPSTVREPTPRRGPRIDRDGYERPSTEPRSRAGSVFERQARGTRGAGGVKPPVAWSPSKSLTEAMDGFVEKLAREGKTLTKEEFAGKFKDFLKEQRSLPGVDPRAYRIPRSELPSYIEAKLNEVNTKVAEYSGGKFSNGKTELP